MIIERGKKGFTLIEMLIVLIIIAVLAVVVLPRIMNARRRAKDEATRQTLAELRTAVDEFESDIGCYPRAIIDLIERVGTDYAGDGAAADAVVEVTVADADTRWMGPYMKTSVVPVPAVGGGAVFEIPVPGVATELGNVVITPGTVLLATDGTAYADW